MVKMMSIVSPYLKRDTAEKDQTAQPHGVLGHLTGWLMGLLNRKLNRLTVKHLDLNVDDAVLEIGCGAGLALREIFLKTLCHRVAGIDPSAEMIEQSMKLNDAQMQSGQLDLQQGKVEALPWPRQSFTKVFAISNFHIWDSRHAGLQEIIRVLRPGGTLTLCLRLARDNPRWFDQPGITQQELAEDLKILRAAGFERIEQHVVRLYQPVLLLTACKGMAQET